MFLQDPKTPKIQTLGPASRNFCFHIKSKYFFKKVKKKKKKS